MRNRTLITILLTLVIISQTAQALTLVSGSSVKQYEQLGYILNDTVTDNCMVSLDVNGVPVMTQSIEDIPDDHYRGLLTVGPNTYVGQWYNLTAQCGDTTVKSEVWVLLPRNYCPIRDLYGFKLCLPNYVDMGETISWLTQNFTTVFVLFVLMMPLLYIAYMYFIGWWKNRPYRT